MASKVYKSAKTRLAVVDQFRLCGRIDLACQRAGVDRTSHYRWLKEHPDYKEAYEAALPEVGDLLMGEMIRRGHEGVLEPVFSGGKRAMDYLVDEAGRVVMEPCSCTRPAASVPGGPVPEPPAANCTLPPGAASPVCKVCKGGGRVPVMAPASVRKYSDQCLVTAAGAHVPGLRTLKHRLVDDQDKDRPLSLDAVHAYCNSLPDDDETLG